MSKLSKKCDFAKSSVSQWVNPLVIKLIYRNQVQKCQECYTIWILGVIYCAKTSVPASSGRMYGSTSDVFWPNLTSLMLKFTMSSFLQQIVSMKSRSEWLGHGAKICTEMSEILVKNSEQDFLQLHMVAGSIVRISCDHWSMINAFWGILKLEASLHLVEGQSL